MGSRKTNFRELERLHADEELTTVGRDLRPWYTRPGILAGAIAAVGLVGVLFVLLLMLSPG